MKFISLSFLVTFLLINRLALMVFGLSYTNSGFYLLIEGDNIPFFRFYSMMEISLIPRVVIPGDALRSPFRQQQTSLMLLTNTNSLASLTYISTHVAAFLSTTISPSTRSVSSSWYSDIQGRLCGALKSISVPISEYREANFLRSVVIDLLQGGSGKHAAEIEFNDKLFQLMS